MIKQIKLPFELWDRRIFTFGLGIGITGISSFTYAERIPDTNNEKPNVIFFLADDLGWSDLGCYGSRFYDTPNIDRFAKEGVRFTNAYSACHVSSPTRASIMTGKYPATLHLTDWLPGRRDFPFQRLKNPEINQHLPYEEVTIAEALKEHGYRTAIYGKWHLGEDPSNPMAHGFDVHVPDWAKGWPNGGYHSPFKLEGITDKEGDYLTDRLTDEALKFIENSKGHPFFLYLSHFAVHDPVEGREDLVKKYEEKLKKLPPPEGPRYILEGNPDELAPINLENKGKYQNNEYQDFSKLSNRMSKIKQRQDNVQFAAMVESVDESLGRILDKLKELGLNDNTIVIFFSDNGGRSAATFRRSERIVTDNMLDKGLSTSNLPLRGGKGWLYEGGIRVPMILKWPRHEMKGKECNIPVISIDFYPTIMEMLGLQVPEKQKVDGISIVPLLKGEQKLDRDAIYWHFPHYSNHGMQSPGGAIRSGDYKLLEYYENYSVQLFNLMEDVGEQHDISASNPEIVNKLRSKLHRWRDKVNAQMMGPNPEYVPGN